MAVLAEAVDACATISLGLKSPTGLVELLDAVVAAERTLAGLKLRLIHRVHEADGRRLAAGGNVAHQPFILRNSMAP